MRNKHWEIFTSDFLRFWHNMSTKIRTMTLGLESSDTLKCSYENWHMIPYISPLLKICWKILGTTFQSIFVLQSGRQGANSCWHFTQPGYQSVTYIIYWLVSKQSPDQFPAPRSLTRNPSGKTQLVYLHLFLENCEQKKI